MKKVILLILVLLVVNAFSGCTFQKADIAKRDLSALQSIDDHQRIPLLVGDKELSVEAVNSQASIIKGLGERDSIGSDGMLFFFSDRQVVHFWMRGMRFPLDFVWIDGDKVVSITENVPAPTDPTSTQLPTYSSTSPVTHVLELPAGMIATYGIGVGTSIQFPDHQ